MKAIGGYFEIENEGIGIFPHKAGILLNTGRNALEYILLSIPDIRRIYLPYYTCGVVLEPIKRLGVPFDYYHINGNLEIDRHVVLKKGEYIIVNNYYGIKDAYIGTLVEKYGDRLIVDCAQAFFAPVISGIKMFYSIRKFVGVPDGGVAYCDKGTSLFHFKQDNSIDRLDHLYIRKEQGAEVGFKLYQANEKKLDNQNVCLMSTFTSDILERIDYNSIVTRRRENYLYLHKVLKRINHLSLPKMDTFCCPMVYPFMGSIDKNIRQELIDSKIFVACYWPNVQPYRDFCCEVDMADRIIPLPIDQRYGVDDMDRIIETIAGQ